MKFPSPPKKFKKENKTLISVIFYFISRPKPMPYPLGHLLLCYDSTSRPQPLGFPVSFSSDSELGFLFNY
uniref:Uncharacterized protein n=1 Tax=Rhizophora mucronata TaxID=61149 RepID=A0A2P2J8C1_RHIMU